MKEKKELKAFSLSKFTNYEMIMDSQFASAGAHQSRLLEKYEKNNKYIKNQAISLKIVSSLVMMMMPLMSIFLYFAITEEITPSYPYDGEIFILSFFLWISLIISILYIFLFGLFTTSSLMSGSSFKWLQTLPVSRKDLKRMGFATLIRNLSVPIIVMTFSFPIVLFIVTQNFFTFLSCLLSSFLTTILGISLLIIVSDRFSRIFSESNRQSSKANIFRLVTLVGFFLMAFGSSFVLNFGINAIIVFAEQFQLYPPARSLNTVMSIIPFPFAPAYFISLSMIDRPVPLELLGSSLVGMAILAGITYFIYKVAIKSLSSVATFEFDSYKAKKESKRKTDITLEPVVIEVKTTSPVESYMHKDLISSTRDYQSLIFILMPILYPIIMILSMQGVITEEVSSTFSIMILWAIILIASQFIPPLLVGGLLNLEESGSSTLASLPLLPRDQAKGKLILMLIIQGISLTLMAIILTLLTKSVYVLILMVGSLPISWTLLLFVFQMKVRLFGTMKYKYILEEVNSRYKVAKWIAIVGADIGICIFILILGFTFFLSLGFIPTTIILFFLGLIGLSVLIYTFTKMFPKEDKLPLYETRGLLRNKPILGAITIMLLYVFFPWIATFVEVIFLPLILGLGFTGILLVEFLLIEGFIALLLLYIVPKGMKLPRKDETILSYTKTIGLTRVKPLGRNLLLGFGASAILCCALFIGGMLLGIPAYNPGFLFSNPNPYPFMLGWFIWIFMIRPGLWEEVAFRGVVIPLLSKKYKKILTILISGVIFGLAHAFNIVEVLLSGRPHIFTLFQVIYTILIGFSIGYMYIKTKSLLPGIIYHYLIDTVGLVFLNVYIENIVLMGVFLIVFLGVIPAILSIGLTKLVFWKDYNKEVIINKQ
ncbi:MAG: CPBP family intramembrane metalloprotease [Candidatus Lokiarchaeota archaeon]|nr:CPBP family intramembrane metalloprotease [Candidatus Lokiarchaeota archaeon]